MPVLVDAVVVGVALEDVEFGGRLGPVPPRVQRGQVGVLGAVLARHALVQRRPVHDAGLLDPPRQHLLVGVVVVKLLQVVGRHEDVDRLGAGQRRNESRVRLVPAVPDRQGIDDLEARRVATHQQGGIRAGWAQRLVVGHVLPPVAEILGRERLPVGPAMALAQVKREDLIVRDLEALQDVGHHMHLLVEHEQPRVGIHGHHAKVALIPHQHAPGPARLAGFALHRGKVHDPRHLGQPLRHGRQRAGLHLILEIGCFPRLRDLGPRSGSAEQQRRGRDPERDGRPPPHAARSLTSTSGRASTMWPLPRSIGFMAPGCPSSRNAGAQRSGFDALLPRSWRKSSGRSRSG